MAEIRVWPITPTELAAVGTTMAALFTAWLAWVTRGLARTTQGEVSAQWRPALVPGRTVMPERQTGLPMATRAADHPAIGLQGNVLTVALHNAGTGPALDIEAALPPGDIPMASLGDANVILAGEQRWFTFSMPTPPVHHRLVATYRDLGSTEYTTVVDVNFEAATPDSDDDDGNHISGTRARSSFGPVSLGNGVRAT
jgi:hypothetical protein